MSNYKILVVDDDPDILKIVRDNLELDGYGVRTASFGKEALAYFEKEVFDLIILDLKLPDMDGIQICRTIRQKSDIPITMLTAKDGLSDKILGLESGADDYIVKPFDYLELAARIKARLRRSSPKNSTGSSSGTSPKKIFEFQNIRLDPNTRTVEVNREKVSLTKKEFDLLYLLAENLGSVLEREVIKNELWPDANLYKWSRTIDVHIQHLRAKLKDDPAAPHLIITVPGVGYMLKES
jgi:DNA-binding response OmpR family regulator